MLKLCVGSVPEWLMGADCKSAGKAYVGSNPTRPNILYFINSPCNSVVEYFLGKKKVTSSILVKGFTFKNFQTIVAFISFFSPCFCTPNICELLCPGATIG